MGPVPKSREDLFHLAARSALLVARGKMSPQEGKAVADLVGRASRVLSQLPAQSAEGLQAMGTGELVAMLRQSLSQLDPTALEGLQAPTSSDQPEQPAAEVIPAGPGVAQVLQLLAKRDENAA